LLIEIDALRAKHQILRQGKKRALQQKSIQDEAWEHEAWEREAWQRREGGSLASRSGHIRAPLLAIHSTQ